ncbi:hypothetical protein [Neomicrococcus lactis]|uniref:Uncharacterized protein n=1 Tax=Neomicrococcus lactis TaxID=732241 RepID=A0A7W8YCM1_9MICC|nr:hypothetical protein [Neomicrococcus lactis]MBB5599042.1 hypothetical protein [Neomicrococcus lactis]
MIDEMNQSASPRGQQHRSNPVGLKSRGRKVVYAKSASQKRILESADRIITSIDKLERERAK